MGSRRVKARKNVEIQFLERFRGPMLATPQIKVATARTKKYGECRDRFRAWGAEFEISSVVSYTADAVASLSWHEEGFDSEADFRATWRKIHPRLPWDRLVWLHWFRRVKP